MNLRAPLLISLCGMAATAVCLTLASSAYDAAQARSVTYTYLADAFDPVERFDSRVIWQPAPAPLVRSLSEGDKDRVSIALTSAWRAHAAASATGDGLGLADYFSGVALDRARLSASQSHAEATQMVVLKTEAAPVFQHLDGSVLQIAGDALTVRYAIEGDALTHYALTEDQVVTTLMNESSGWRVFSHEMTDSRRVAPARIDATDLGKLAGINYYPSRTPWSRFWAEFDPAVIAEDFDLISDLGANSVRFFLSDADFRGASGAAALDKLEVFLSLAEAADLKLVPTLFDLKAGYGAARWADDVAYLERVLPVLAASDAVVMIDLKNEPDLDFEHYTRPVVEAWIRTMVALSRRHAPDLPVTIGWSHADPAIAFADAVDVVTYHDYAEMDETRARFDAVRAAAGEKPVYITEIGETSYSFVAGFPGSLSSQAQRLADRMDHLSDADGIFIWTLHDLANPDSKAVGHSPWNRGLQSAFGLLGATGTPKPAYGEVKLYFERLFQ